MSAAKMSSKALKVLGVTEEEVRLQKALIVSLDSPSPTPPERRFYVEVVAEQEESDPSKPQRVLGLANEPPLSWLQQKSGETLQQRRLPSKALATLGATIDDVRIEKALLVLGEAPGREVPAGRLPRPRQPRGWEWAVAAKRPPPGASIFLWACLPWGILAPLNVLKLQLNKARRRAALDPHLPYRAVTLFRAVAAPPTQSALRACARCVCAQVSPGAHLWVPLETEQCQAACGIARMWASLFWSMQFANAVASIYLHYNREKGLALLSVSHKLVVGGLLLKAYIDGVIFWPIGLVAPLLDFAIALRVLALLEIW